MEFKCFHIFIIFFAFLYALSSSISGLPCEITFLFKENVLNQSILVTNFICFDLSKNDFILASLLKNTFVGCRILGWKLFKYIDGFIPLDSGFSHYLHCQYREFCYYLVVITLRIIFFSGSFGILFVLRLLKFHNDECKYRVLFIFSAYYF